MEYSSIHHYIKYNNKNMEDYDKNKESSYLKYWDMNKLYRWPMSQKLAVDGFKLVKNTSKFSEDVLEN